MLKKGKIKIQFKLCVHTLEWTIIFSIELCFFYVNWKNVVIFFYIIIESFSGVLLR